MQDTTARKMAAGNLVFWKGKEISEDKYQKMKDEAILQGKAHLRKKHRQERQRVRLQRRKSKAWRRRKAK